jgi:cytochrome c-type biogenesis protein
VLPLLPVIISGSLVDKHMWHPFVISISLAISVVLFTLLLKVFTLFINVPAEFWTLLSGIIILAFGIALLFPNLWDWLNYKLHLGSSSEKVMTKTAEKHSLGGAVLLGAVLGPVFSSCSPTYFVILATVLPVSLRHGLIYLLVYAFGLMLILNHFQRFQHSRLFVDF